MSGRNIQVSIKRQERKMFPWVVEYSPAKHFALTEATAKKAYLTFDK